MTPMTISAPLPMPGQSIPRPLFPKSNFLSRSTTSPATAKTPLRSSRKVFLLPVRNQREEKYDQSLQLAGLSLQPSPSLPLPTRYLLKSREPAHLRLRLPELLSGHLHPGRQTVPRTSTGGHPQQSSLHLPPQNQRGRCLPPKEPRQQQERGPRVPVLDRRREVRGGSLADYFEEDPLQIGEAAN